MLMNVDACIFCFLFYMQFFFYENAMLRHAWMQNGMHDEILNDPHMVSYGRKILGVTSNPLTGRLYNFKGF